MVQYISERIKIEFSLHRTRRFYARYLYDMGTQPGLIQKLMGYEKLGTSLLYVQSDAVNAFSALRSNTKKLDFTANGKSSTRNSEYILRPERKMSQNLKSRQLL